MSDFDKKTYDKKYLKQNYKTIPLDVRFDFFEEINEHIKRTGEKRTAFIKRAIMETIKYDEEVKTTKF